MRLTLTFIDVRRNTCLMEKIPTMTQTDKHLALAAMILLACDIAALMVMSIVR